MDSLIALQRWLYGSVSAGLADVASGAPSAIIAAMILAVVFGALHALMPGHGKTVLVSYHFGRPGRWPYGLATGAILALTHVGVAVILVLAGVAVISRAFAAGGRTPAFETASAGLIALIGAFLLWQALRTRAHAHAGGGTTLAIVTGLIPCPLTTFIMSYALARNMLGAGVAVTAAMALGMILTIGGIAAAAVLARENMMGFLVRTETLRHRLGKALELGSAAAVLGLGLWPLMRRVVL